TLVDHVGETHVAPGIKPVARRQEDHWPKIDLTAHAADTFSLPFGERPPGAEYDFERARDSGGIGRVEPGRGARVEPGKLGPILLDRSVAYRCANPGINGWNRCDPVEQSTQIEAGSADQDRQSAIRLDIVDFHFRSFGPIRGRARNRAVEKSIQAMLSARSVVFGRGRAQHGKIAVDLAAVGVDDHSAGALGK